MRRRTALPTLLTVAATAAGAGLCGCGLKGALELPERPSNVVIRPAPGVAGAPAPATPGETAPGVPGTAAPAGEQPGTAPATSAPAEEDVDRPPPPDLPRGQRGGISS